VLQVSTADAAFRLSVIRTATVFDGQTPAYTIHHSSQRPEGSMLDDGLVDGVADLAIVEGLAVVVDVAACN
jgi:hypothetical protein